MMSQRFRIITLLAHVLILSTDSLPIQVQSTTTSVSLGTLTLSPVALGTLNHFVNDDDNAVRVLQSSPVGMLIDTAEVYAKGQSEVAVARAAVRAGLVLGESVFVATKFAPQPWRLTADSVVSACRESASRLGVNCIDLYQIHYRDLVQPLEVFGYTHEKDELYWDGLADCYHKGLAANVGVCNYGPIMVKRAYEALAKRDVPLISNQFNFNLMRHRSLHQETKAVCDDLGIKVLAYHPLGKGTLTGKYDADDRSTMPTGNYYYRMKRWVKATESLREVLSRIAFSREKTSAQVAINWILCKGAIPIAGARNAAQAAENAGAIGWSLSNEEIEELDIASSNSEERYTILGKEFTLV